MQKWDVEFIFREQRYRIRIEGVEVFPQGFAAIAPYVIDFTGTTMICDTGRSSRNQAL